MKDKVLEVNRIYCMDAIEGMKKLDDESVDLVVTDPPFNIAAKHKLTIQKGKLVSTMDAFGAWDHFHPFDYDVLIMQLLGQCYRVLKTGGALYMYTAREQNGYFIRQAIARGFTYRNQLAMVKTPQLPSFSKANWRSGFDLCMYLIKDKAKTFNFLSQKELVNVHNYSVRHKQTDHPTEKPLSIIKRLVEVSSNPGDLVLDPFMGSGTTAVACKELGRNYIGFERDPGYVRMARNRLKGGAAISKTHETKST
jgi:site-specific DNA-methyltransferase (adenine-specific)